MPKGFYDRTTRFEYDANQDAYIKEMVANPKITYGKLVPLFNVKFGSSVTRSSLIGRAHRLGVISPNKNLGGRGLTKHVSPEEAKARKRQTNAARYKRLHPSTGLMVHRNTLPEGILRNEGERGDGRIRRTRASKDEIAKRSQGFVPDIIDEESTTTINILESADDVCKWPASSDVRCMEVCGAPATCGAYCDRHGSLAYRVMPTRKRHVLMRAAQTQHVLRLPPAGRGGGERIPDQYVPPLLLPPMSLDRPYPVSDLLMIPWFLPAAETEPVIDGGCDDTSTRTT